MVLKTLAALKPEERRAKQNGVIGIEVKKPTDVKANKFTVRLSSQGTQAGERVVLQFEGKKLTFSSLDALGMRQKDARATRRNPGPETRPGGGLGDAGRRLVDRLRRDANATDRFTRNYAAVQDVKSEEREILNVAITPFDAAAGETPATVLPKLIRTYPDVFVVRDIVDLASLEILIEQIQKEKRLVITSVRAKEAIEAILRVLALKVKPAELAAVVTAALNVRLVRKLCEQCKEAYPPPAEVLKQMGLPAGPHRVVLSSADQPHRSQASGEGVRSLPGDRLLRADGHLRAAGGRRFVPLRAGLAAEARAAAQGGAQNETPLAARRGAAASRHGRDLAARAAAGPQTINHEESAVYLDLVLLLVFVSAVAFLFNAGLWSNALTLINVITAGLIAMNYFEPLADRLEKWSPGYRYFWDFLSIWLVFVVASRSCAP